LASLVDELQAKAIDSKTPVGDLLRRVKIVAAKLDLQDTLEWVDAELEGYASGPPVPPYRELNGELKAFNPYHGWQVVLIGDDSLMNTISSWPCRQPTSEIEDLLKRGDGSLMMTVPPSLQRLCAQHMAVPLEVKLHLDRAQLARIIESVRNRILAWSLSLEKAGIKGDGLSFSEPEKRLAHSHVTTINIQSIDTVGAVGEISGKARVNAQKTISTPDIDSLRKLIKDVRNQAQALPQKQLADIQTRVSALEALIEDRRSHPSKIRSALANLQNVVKSLTGWGAQAVLSAEIARLLGTH